MSRLFPLQDANRDMKEMVLTKPASADTPRKRRRRSSKAKKTPMDKTEAGDGEASSIKPRRLTFHDESDGTEDDSFNESADEAPTPVAEKSRGRNMDDDTPAKNAVPEGDDDLFAGKFARPTTSPRATPAPASRKKNTGASTAKPTKDPRPASSYPDMQAKTDEQRDEEDLRNDEVMKLLDKIRENRLVAILPLDCKKLLDCL